MRDNYHHGNLKNELIETAIRIISEKGFDHLSLRNISSECGVSHNAIYRHFESKEKLIETCRNFVTVCLMNRLNKAVEDSESSADALEKLSCAYVAFYISRPTYYSFLYRNSGIKLVFSSEPAGDNYPPLELFRKVYCAYGRQKKMSDGECITHLIQLWSMIHGMVSLLISPNVEWNGSWRECLRDIII